ncbi:hypothetical protein U3516DRAFT_833839 [Neocallimastix sp. 'constans']
MILNTKQDNYIYIHEKYYKNNNQNQNYLFMIKEFLCLIITNSSILNLLVSSIIVIWKIHTSNVKFATRYLLLFQNEKLREAWDEFNDIKEENDTIMSKKIGYCGLIDIYSSYIFYGGI